MDYLQLGTRNKSEWSTTAGYTTDQFVALYFATILLPLGILCSLIFAVQSFKYATELSRTLNIVVYTAIATAYYVGCYLAYEWVMLATNF